MNIIKYIIYDNVHFFNLRLARQARAALKYLNKERKKYGHPAMILDEKLCMQANAYANHLATSSYYQKAPRNQLHGAGNGINFFFTTGQIFFRNHYCLSDNSS